MPVVSDWIYCRLVETGHVFLPRMPFWFGPAEFSKAAEADEAFATALEDSVRAHSISINFRAPGPASVFCARVLVVDESETEAQRHCSYLIAELVRAYSDHIAHSDHLRLTAAGYLYDLRARRVVPLLPAPEPRPRFGAIYTADELARHPLHTLNSLYTSPNSFGELGQAFRRSAHWRSLAANALDDSEALLFYWMSVECLSKTRLGENIVPKLLAASGFPIGRTAKLSNVLLSRRLLALPNYRAWRKQLHRSLEALRRARNNIAHAGYRGIELPMILSEVERQRGMLLLPLIARALSDQALLALNFKIRSVREMWLQYEKIVRDDLDNLAWWLIERLQG